jgi:cobaltochelatase CobT
MDGATSQANDEQYLDLHLREVIARIDAAGQVQIFGIGVGLDLSPYYAHCQAVDFTHGLSNHVFQEILGLMAGRTHR